MSFFSTCKLGRSSFVGFCWPCSFVHSMWAEETLPQSLPATALTPGTDVPPGSVFAGQFRTQMGSQLELPSYWMRFSNTWISHEYLNSLWKKYLIRLKNSPQSVPHSAEDVRNDCPFWGKARNSAHLQLAQFVCRWRHGHLFLFVGLRGSAEELKLPSNNLWVTRRQLGPQATNTSWMLAIVKLPCLMVYE